jgi:hypothetical protein
MLFPKNCSSDDSLDVNVHIHILRSQEASRRLCAHEKTRERLAKSLYQPRPFVRCGVSSKGPFKVTEPETGDVSDLRILVLDKGKNGSLCGVDAKDLVIWQVCHLQI